ncbi:RINT-1 family protein [Rhodotorula toruloides ATCC 204091]|uniref:BY PROTMAP: gi/342321543/gb/EGU13476.1/ RINT-1 family protein [Rhodotorula glutinis ATCC 204091] n=1 Tax=Rhodotorula toruloides TaxID=5286 RepID=A0A0K3CMZ1_RHOTO|nr:RINT-1 family protein [Rhodotorula toruloides ATCC 204091]
MSAAGLTRLAALQTAPSLETARNDARSQLSSSLPTPLVPSQLGEHLARLLEQQRTQATRLEGELAVSREKGDQLLSEARDRVKQVRERTERLKVGHAETDQGLRAARDKLVSDLEAKDEGADGLTLRERLVVLSQRRKELEAAKKWFGAIVKAEDLGMTVLRSLDTGSLPQAFRAYVSLVEYIKTVHQASESTKAAMPNGAAGMVALTSHLVGMANSVWNSLVRVLSSRLLSKLESLGWPQPFAEPLDPYEDPRVAEFQTAFVDLLTLEHLQANNPIPGPSKRAVPASSKPKPLLALGPLVHPLLLRFKWHFEGDRGTNRIDKPEYPLSHVLNLLTAHERFLSEDIQFLLDSNGFDHIDAVNEFTSLLLPPLASRLRHHLPQLLTMPPILAHTVYQVVEFDQQLRSRGYRPRTWPTVLPEGEEPEEEEGEWEGLSETILARQEWFERWLDGEREYAWHIVSEEDYDADARGSGTRPTNSALRVKELAEQLAGSYAARITSSLDAFESLSFGILPGALGQTTAATAGVGGVVRLVRAGVSARWMSEKCAEWGEDAFFLTLYDYLSSSASTPGKLDRGLQDAADDVLDNSEGTVFDREHKVFENLADRSEELIVRHCAREVSNELKPYYSKRWEEVAEEDATDRSLSPELIAPLSLLSSLLSTLVQSFPPATRTTLYRRIAGLVSQSLYDRLLVSHGWTESSAQQLQYDLENGFLVAVKEAGLPQRGIMRGWEVARGGATVLALPSQASQQGGYVPGGDWTFSRVMQVAFDDSVTEEEGGKFAEMMDDLGVGEALTKSEVQSLLRRRPECWSRSSACRPSWPLVALVALLSLFCSRPLHSSAFAGHLGKPPAQDALPPAYRDPEGYLNDPRFHRTTTYRPSYSSSSSPPHTVSFAVAGSPSADAPTVVWLNGMGGHRLAAVLLDGLFATKGVRLVTLDRPSGGKSTPVPLADRVQASHEAFLAILAELDIKRFSILSHSNGLIYTLFTLLNLPSDLTVLSWTLSSPYVPPWLSGSQLLSLARWVPSPLTSRLGTLLGGLQKVAEPVMRSAGWSSGVVKDWSSAFVSMGTSVPSEPAAAGQAPNGNGTGEVDESQIEPELLPPPKQLAGFRRLNARRPPHKKLFGGEFIPPGMFNEGMKMAVSEGLDAMGLEAMVCLRQGDGARWGWGEPEEGASEVREEVEAKLYERGFAALKAQLTKTGRQVEMSVWYGEDDALVPAKGRVYLRGLLVDSLGMMEADRWKEIEDAGHDHTLGLSCVMEPLLDDVVRVHQRA